MSTTAPQLSSDLRQQSSGRTRLQPIGGSGRSVYIFLGCALLSVVCALASRSYSHGANLQISSNAPGAAIQVDGSVAYANPTGAAAFPGVPFGSRSLRISHRDFEPIQSSLQMGWLSSHDFSFQMKPVPLILNISTVPGAQVLLNGQSAGLANNQGFFVKSGMNPGDYDIQVKSPGYATFHIVSRHLSPPVERIYASLSVSQERLNELQKEQQQAQAKSEKFRQLVGTAQQQFTARQYRSALAAINEALTLQPGDAQAQQVKNQIVQTINILK